MERITVSTSSLAVVCSKAEIKRRIVSISGDKVILACQGSASDGETPCLKVFPGFGLADLDSPGP
jgi:hypothetical protein